MKNNNLTFYSLLSANRAKEIILQAGFENSYDNFLAKTSIPNYTADITIGKNFYDLIPFNDGINFAISHNFLTLLNREKITGWKTYDLEIKNVKDQYYGFQITGRSGATLTPKKKGFHVGYEFDKNTWDGSDFFCPDSSCSVFISEKLYEILKKEKISNVDMEDISKVEFYSPGI